MALVFLIFGLAGFAALPAAWNTNCKFARTDPPAKWRFVWRLRWLIGFVLAVASILMFYPVHGDDGQWYRIFGIPFPAFAFDERGHDYVGCTSIPFMVLNFVLWLFFPHFPLWMYTRVWKRPIPAPRQV